jgi:Protein of unknown function (DUF4229)
MAEDDLRPRDPADDGPLPSLWPWLLLYTAARLVIAAVLVLVLWIAGLGSYAGLLFGILLALPVSYLLLKPVRERVNVALVARQERKRREREDLRARLSGAEDD